MHSVVFLLETTKGLSMKVLFFCIFCCICIYTSAQNITTVAGNGTPGYNGDGISAINAQLYGPESITIDASGNIYIADTHNNRIRKVDASGNISTIAGTGANGYGGDSGAATAAVIYVSDVALDMLGNIYLADAENNVIRKINAQGIITTVAGNGNGAGTFNGGFSGDDGPADSAELSDPDYLAVDAFGNIYIDDEDNNRIRKVNTSGIINTIAGSSGQGFVGDGGPDSLAELYNPDGVSVDNKGNIYIADFSNYRIRKIDTAGVITTVAGSGVPGYAGDGGLAINAKIQPVGNPRFVNGTLFFIDKGNRIRKVDSAGIITTIAGNGTAGYSGDNGPAASAELNAPANIAFDRNGNLYVADAGNNRIRIIANVTTGVNNLTTNGGILFYPNPASNVLMVKGLSADMNYKLLNMHGAIIQNGMVTVANNKILLQALASGTYILELKNGQQLITTKVIKQ